MKDRLHGFIDSTGREVIPPEYFGVSQFAEGLATAARLLKDGLFGSTGRTGRFTVVDIRDIH